MLPHTLLMLTFGLLLLIGGFIGYIKSGSIVSLVMGFIFSFLSIASGIAIFQNIPWSRYAALSLTLFLGIFFGYRFSLSYRFMPAGLFSLVSLAVFLGLLLIKKEALKN